MAFLLFYGMFIDGLFDFWYAYFMLEWLVNLDMLYRWIGLILLALLALGWMLGRYIPGARMITLLGIPGSLILYSTFHRVYVETASVHAMLERMRTLLLLILMGVVIASCLMMVSHRLIHAIFRRVRQRRLTKGRKSILAGLPTFIRRWLIPRSLHVMSIVGIVPVMLMIALTSAVFLLDYGRDLIPETTYYPGVHVDGIPLEGKTFPQALDEVQQHNQTIIGEYKIQLAYEDEVFLITSADLNMSVNDIAVLADAYRIGRQGSYIRRVDNILRLYHQEYINLETRMTYDEQALVQMAEHIVDRIVQPAENARMMVTDDDEQPFIYYPEQMGVEITVEEVAELIHQSIEEKQFQIQNLQVRRTMPTVTEAMLREQTQLIAEYTTYPSANVSRNANIAISGEAIEGTIMPGETFSFNASTGKRTRDKGYQMAKIILGGRIVPGLAGGVCQTSSTLFNALLLAELQVTEHRNHSLNVSYVPKGLDATVNYPNYDLKFINNLDHPVYIRSVLDPDVPSFTIRIFGKPQYEDMHIQVQYRREGGRYQIVRDYYRDDELVHTEIVSVDGDG